MRIGVFHTTLPEAGRKLGGVEVAVHRLANQLSRRSHDVEVLTVQGEAPDDAEYAVRRIGSPHMAMNRAMRFAFVPTLLNRLDLSRFDVLSLHGDDWFFIRRSLPTVRTFYGSAWREAQTATRLRRKIYQSLCFPVELLSSRLATDSYTACAGMARGYRLAGVLPLAVGLTPGAGGARIPAKSERPTVLFVGTWNGRKRGAWLRDQFLTHVVPRQPDAELWMVADECEESDRVRWIRFPSDAELSALYSQAWAFCLPSTYEGFGLPYLEAMAHGTPVLASPNPGSKMVLGEGRYGLIAGDDELGPGLVRLLGDGTRRQEMAELGRRRAKDFSWKETCDAYEVAFERAIATFQGARR